MFFREGLGVGNGLKPFFLYLCLRRSGGRNTRTTIGDYIGTINVDPLSHPPPSTSTVSLLVFASSLREFGFQRF